MFATLGVGAAIAGGVLAQHAGPMRIISAAQTNPREIGAAGLLAVHDPLFDASVSLASAQTGYVSSTDIAVLFDAAALGGTPHRFGGEAPIAMALNRPQAPAIIVAAALTPADPASNDTRTVLTATTPDMLDGEEAETAALPPQTTELSPEPRPAPQPETVLALAVPLPLPRPADLLEQPEPETPRPAEILVQPPQRPAMASPQPQAQQPQKPQVQPQVQQPPLSRHRTRLASAQPAPKTDDRSFFEKLFGVQQKPAGSALAYASPEAGADAPGTRLIDRVLPGRAPTASSGTAVYDISAHTVYMPNGERLEAHSGLGSMLDDPRYVHVRMRGATPPHTYELTERESLFHGVRALRLTPVDGNDAIHGREGLLAHTYMLGPRGDSNGCVSFRDYNRFLQAYLRGDIKRLVVVAGRG